MLIAAVIAGALLVALSARLALWRRAAPPLPAAPPSPPPTTVLLPVRNEAREVAACLATLLAQTAAPRLVVADDGSTDRTAAIVSEIALGEPRLSLFTVGELAAGWLGKPHALWRALARVDSEWVLFTDADTRHHPELLARAHAAAAAQGLDLVSIAGRQVTAGLGEGLLMAMVFALLDYWLGDWHPVACGGGPPVANGQFMLLRRSALEAAGGLAAIRSEPLDDVAIAERLRAAGFRTGFVRAPEALAVRMYRGFVATWRGWRRSLGALSGRAPGVFALALLVFWSPVLIFAAALALGDPLAAAGLWAGGAAASAAARWGSGHPVWHALLFPLDGLLIGALIIAAIRARWRGRRQEWKGRAVRI